MAASAHAYRVLACRPIEAEAQLAYAALGDLLADVSDDVLGELPEPQRRALEVALLRREPEGQQPLQRAVAVGTLGVLRVLSRQSPLLVGIDDVQWLDPDSESVLAFVTRRLTRRASRAARDEASRGIVRRPARSSSGHFPRAVRAALRVGSLEPAELDRLLVARSDARLSARSLVRLHARSRRKPLLRARDRRAMLSSAPVRPSRTTTMPDPGEPARSGARPSGAPVSTCARGDGDRCSAFAADDGRSIDAVGEAICSDAVEAAARGGHRRTGRVTACGSLTRCSPRSRTRRSQPERRRSPARSPGRDPRRSGGSAGVISLWRPRAPTPPSPRRSTRPPGGRRARGAPASAAELWEQARRLTPADAEREARRRGDRGGGKTLRRRRGRPRPGAAGGGRRRVAARQGALTSADTARLGVRSHRGVPRRRGGLPRRARRRCR